MKFQPPSRAALTLTLGMTLLVATTICAQQLSTPRSNDEATTKLVCEMVKRYHVGQKDIDDAVSAKLFDKFLKDLDPQKLYFSKADVDELAKWRTRLDDLAKAGNVDFAYTAYDLFLKRLDERIAKAHEFVDANHDFGVDEVLVTDPDKLAWAADAKELDERWRKRIKFDLLSLKIADTALEEAKKRLHKRYYNVRQTMRQTEDGEKLETYLSALTHCFDPHSSYMSPDTLEDFRISMELSLEGIGAALRAEDGYTVVANIVPGGAAEKDGRLKVGDKIIGVRQEGETEFVDVVEMKLSKVVRYIRGKKGTPVFLQVKKSGEAGEIKVYDLIRQKIELKSAEVKGEIIDLAKRFPGAVGRIGVIHIPSFYRDFRGAQRGDDDFKSTARDTETVLKDFQAKGGVDAVVIDLRTNGGGALTEAIDVSGLFIDKGPVVQVKELDGQVKSHDDTEAGEVYTGPLVVICNRLSASASEIFAGVIKDYQRGIVVGDQTTHGKGTVQNVMPVSRNQLFQFLNQQSRGALKLTINQFYRVNGDSTQNKGVLSDVVLPSLLDHMELGESYLENALAFDQIRPAQYRPEGKVTPDMIAALQTASSRRVAADAKFQQVEKDIRTFVERKKRPGISLNEATLRREKEEEKNRADKSEQELEEEPKTDGPIFPVNHYNDEVLRVAADYVAQLRGLKTVGK